VFLSICCISKVGLYSSRYFL